ncbi:MAG: hypothetical protein IH899_04715, partial [Planctomycetes bacterium]|nr:hypothetical protein [Planctomycetota bacterium]
MKESARNYVIRTVNHYRISGKFNDAIAAAERGGKMIDDAETTKHLLLSVYDTWSRKYSGKKEWQSAIDVYKAGLKKLPKTPHLTNNLLAMWDTRAGHYTKSKDWRQSADVYEKAMKEHPD